MSIIFFHHCTYNNYSIIFKNEELIPKIQGETFEKTENVLPTGRFEDFSASSAFAEWRSLNYLDGTSKRMVLGQQ